MFQNLFLLAVPDFSQPAVWMSLLTLTFLEIVLGVDNIIFISIVSNRLPKEQQAKARRLGLLLAMAFRSALLLSITWVMGLTQPLFTLPLPALIGAEDLAISVKDLILLLGGLFLLYKSVMEINHKLEGEEDSPAGKPKGSSTFSSVILQIILVDLVFSFDSILTAVGLSDQVMIMIAAVIISILIMMQFADAISHFINKHPSLQILALSFLILIGAMLVMEGLHQHVNKAYIYFAIAFSLSVEVINLRRRAKQTESHAVRLHNELLEQAVEEGAMEDDPTFSALDHSEKR
jgi:predicted tellurium resistance membrane protein TerC